MKTTQICERCKKEYPPSEIDMFTGICWDCLSEIEDDKREAARFDIEQMESALVGGWK